MDNAASRAHSCGDSGRGMCSEVRTSGIVVSRNAILIPEQTPLFRALPPAGTPASPILARTARRSDGSRGGLSRYSEWHRQMRDRFSTGIVAWVCVG